MTCQDGTCEFNPAVTQRKTMRTADNIKYGQLWARLEMPKLLERRERKE